MLAHARVQSQCNAETSSSVSSGLERVSAFTQLFGFLRYLVLFAVNYATLYSDVEASHS